MRCYGLEHVGLAARDPEALATWYADVLDAQEVSRSGGEAPIIFLSFGGGALLELVPAAAEDLAAADLQRGHICWGVSSLETALEELTARGIQLDREVFAAYDGSRVAFFRDPEGNLLQLVERVAESDVHAAVF